MTIKRYKHTDGNEYAAVYIFSYEWDWFDWSLSSLIERRRHPSGGSHTIYQQHFAFRCTVCRAFTMGCGKHWFCGFCKDCANESDMDAVFEAATTPEKLEEYWADLGRPALA
jgi:hypothetical protein